MPRRLLAPILALGLFAFAVPIVAERAPANADLALRRWSSFSGLEPGAFVTHPHVVPIDVVLIGFDISGVSRTDLAALLPATSTPAVRYPQFYGLNGRAVGLEYEFKYTLTRKNRQFEDRFFRFLARTGTPGNPTVYMTAYNNQANNVVNVTGPVLYIDAPTVERWLESNANPRTNGLISACRPRGWPPRARGLPGPDSQIRLPTASAGRASAAAHDLNTIRSKGNVKGQGDLL
jgi:hypothetical protein